MLADSLLGFETVTMTKESKQENAVKLITSHTKYISALQLLSFRARSTRMMCAQPSFPPESFGSPGNHGL
jgi:hypothetical protein